MKTTTKEKLMEMMNVESLEVNKAQKEGSLLPVSIWEAEDGSQVLVRIDMPGANIVKVDVDDKNNRIKIVGLEDPLVLSRRGSPVKPANECRTYELSLLFDANRFRAAEKTHELTDGIFYLQIKSHNKSGASNNTNVVLETKQGRKTSAYNPVISKGKDQGCWYWLTDEGFILAVDMPGTTNEDMTLCMQSSNISFGAQQTEQHEKERQAKLPRRFYVGHLYANLEKFNVPDVRGQISNGILRIEVPRKQVPPPDHDILVPFMGLMLYA